MDKSRLRRVGRITRRDREVFQSLILARRPLCLLALADRTGMSWTTVRAIVARLESFGIVLVVKSSRKTFVRVDPAFLKRSASFMSEVRA